MKVEVKALSSLVDSVQVIGNWIVGCLVDLDVPPIEDDARDRFRRRARFSLSFPDEAFQIIGDEALFEFVNLPELDVDAAAQYIERHGIFAVENLKRPPLAPFPKGVDQFWRKSQTVGTPFALVVRDFYAAQKEIRNLQRLADALRVRNLKLMGQFVLAQSPSQNELQPFEISRCRLILRESIQSGIGELQLGIAEMKTGLIPFLAPADLKTALYLALLDQITRQVPIAECENGRCKKIFERTQPQKRFCSTRCQSLVKVHRFRNRPQKPQKHYIRKEQR